MHIPLDIHSLDIGICFFLEAFIGDVYVFNCLDSC